jgi:tetratricopeptide (TPR) repeat protein
MSQRNSRIVLGLLLLASLAWAVPQLARWSNTTASAQMTGGNSDRAEWLWTVAGWLTPWSEAPHTSRGIAHYQQRRWVEALASFNKAALLAPDDAHTHDNRGLVLMRMQLYEEAASAFSRVIDLKPRNVQAWRKRAEAYRRNGRLDLARADFDSAVAASPDDMDARFERSHLLSKTGETTAALADIEHAIAKHPKSPRPLVQRAWARFHRSDFAGTRADLDAAKKLGSDPWGVNLEKRLDERLAAEKRYAKSFREAMADVIRKPEAVRSYEQRANWRTAVGHNLTALKDLATAQKLALKNAASGDERFEIVRARVRILDSIWRYDQALNDLTEAAKDPAQAARAIARRGVLLVEIGRYDDARKDFELLFARHTKNGVGEPHWYVNHARILLRRGEADAALALLAKGATAYPKSTYLSERRDHLAKTGWEKP